MKKIVLSLVMTFFLFGCTSTGTFTYSNYETIYINTEQDGSLTVQSWGSGRNRNDAVEQARKNAVADVLFKGIANTNNGYTSKAIIMEVNARERYQDYFNVFFADGGEYRNYVSMEDTRIGTKVREKGDLQVKYGFVVRVLVPQLKQKMIEDGIIK